ncbi:hypothetical protein [Streptomyces sp. ODS28]|uniref:hypothetical protein n=1 Tax=Streptomyces sp. ODS28 TaxID=3136688 RepID=UPI0031EFA51A
MTGPVRHHRPRRRGPGRLGTTVTATAAALAGLVVLSGCADGVTGSGDDRTDKQNKQSEARTHQQRSPARPIGDGSTALTGSQPNQPTPHRLRPGERPPQFVVFSWDGAGEDSKKLFSRFREAGRKYGATQTYFLSGIYLLPEGRAKRYSPPGHPPGASDIGYLKDRNVRSTLRQVRGAWLDGSEIGTHFNGHFCGPGGVGDWSVGQWRSEIRQARSFVSGWRTNTGWKAVPPLPFDYGRELVGGRAPCLEGQENLLRAGRAEGFRYDSSGNGKQVWPGKKQGLWDLSLQQVPMPGSSYETLSMDYNFLANQSVTTDGPESRHPAYKKQMRDGLLAGFERAYKGNRAPMVVGNHFEDWNGGVYMDAVEEVMKKTCRRDEVRCVSFRQLVDWLDAQDPKTLAELRKLDVGERPKGGWSSFGQVRPAAEKQTAARSR